MAPIISPYGSWKSPITADLAAGGEIGLEQVRIDRDEIYWIERRPQEGGRKVIVRRSADGNLGDVTPAGFNARTRVHEYGGGDYAVAGGTIIFSNFADQRLYRQDRGSEPKALTPQAARRYADGQIDRGRNLFVCVREDHSGGGESTNTLVRVDLATGESAVIASGNDFYSSPRLSSDGSWLAWLTWNHPNMPWDGTELWLGKLTSDGSIVEQHKIAGGDHESICQPEWSPT
ncbi:MAG TPA: S9 family peptidase, partial [Candidatus Binatia bacterium]